MILCHPDCTVGCGISPHQLIKRSWTLTTGGEFHPAPRTTDIIYRFLFMSIAIDMEFTLDKIFIICIIYFRYAPVVELADTMDLGSIATACRFKSCQVHQL